MSRPKTLTTLAKYLPSFMLSLCALSACDDGKEGGDPGGEGGSSESFANVYVSLQAKASTNLAAGQTQNCRVQDVPNGPAADGTCLTADNVEVWASGAYLTSFKSSGSARLLGGGSGLGKSGYLEGALFDLSNLSTLKGEDTLWEDYSKKSEWEFIHINLVYLRIFFTVKSEKWEMLIPYVNLPLYEENWVKTCYGDAYVEELKVNGNPLPGLSVQRGDYLFCKQANNQKCALSQFQWFDTVSSTLSSTRPTSPRKFAFLNTHGSDTCNKPAGDTPPDVTNYSVPLFANINQPRFKLYGDFSHGSASQSNPNGQKPASVSQEDWSAHGEAGLSQEPHFIYTLEQSGTTTTGNKVNVKLAFDLSNFLVMDKIYDIASTPIESILKVITTKDIFLREGTAKGNEFLPNLPVDATVILSNAPLAELYEKPAAGTKATVGSK